MEFKFGVYTEVTDFALEHNPEYAKSNYIRFFVCPDTHDFWYCRILKDFNEDYNEDVGSYLLERDKIGNDYKGQNMTEDLLLKIVENDTFENWDFQQSYDLDELIDMIDDGWGILNKKEN